MVRIRLSRGGSKKRPFYQIVVADIRAKRDGKYIERLGFYNPIARGNEIPLRINQERVAYWLKCGAQPTETAQQLLKKAARAVPTPATE